MRSFWLFNFFKKIARGDFEGFEDFLAMLLALAFLFLMYYIIRWGWRKAKEIEEAEKRKKIL